jgi:hypothetical protein
LTFHRARLSDFNAAFSAGKSTANDTISPCQSLDKQLINLKESTTSNKQVLTQADLDTEIMVLDYCYWFILHYYNSATKTYSKIFNVFLLQKFIIKESLPLQEVQRECFLDLMGSLVGKLVVKKRTFFTERLLMEYSNTKTS